MTFDKNNNYRNSKVSKFALLGRSCKTKFDILSKYQLHSYSNNLFQESLNCRHVILAVVSTNQVLKFALRHSAKLSKKHSHEIFKNEMYIVLCKYIFTKINLLKNTKG